MPHPDAALLHAVLRGPSDPAIIVCEARIRAAQLAGDVDALDDLIADELLFTGPDGRLATKAEDLSLHRSRTVRFLSHEPRDLQLRAVGADVVLSALQAELRVEVAGRLVEGLFAYTRVWVRGADARWRVVGGHVSVVA